MPLCAGKATSFPLSGPQHARHIVVLLLLVESSFLESEHASAYDCSKLSINKFENCPSFCDHFDRSMVSLPQLNASVGPK
jgi:hypothetical protein